MDPIVTRECSVVDAHEAFAVAKDSEHSGKVLLPFYSRKMRGSPAQVGSTSSMVRLITRSIDA
jgi:hypothetical protein